MISWQNLISQELLPSIQPDGFWHNYLQGLIDDNNSGRGLHLAIFVEPYLTYILEGKKTVESRFSMYRQSPYRQVAKGDILLLKKTGGPIIGLCLITEVWFYHLDLDSWKSIRREFTESLCAQDPEFWKRRRKAAFATLMQVDSVKEIHPLTFTKRDRRGWVVLKASQESGDKT